MIETMLQLNFWVATGSLVLEIALVFFIVWFLASKQSLINFIKSCTRWRNVFTYDWSQMMLIKVFTITFVSFVMSLIYSEIFNQTPCALCWFERIFMYGIMILSALGLYRKEAKFIFPYINVFAWLGLTVALYHHILQMTATAGSHIPCPASGGDCAKRIIFEYGHITFPWIAAIVFITVILSYWVEKALRSN